VLDNAGLWKEHGLPKMDRNWSLHGTDKNICPSQKAIIGIMEISTRKNNQPQESKGIRLVEVGELDNINSANTINFNNIEKNLIDKKILTMRERIEYLIKQVQKLEHRRANETDEDIQEIIDEKINALQKELYDLQEKLQPKRFEQVIELIIGKCQEMIDINEIFVDGDKDIFLKRFVEPYLKSNNFNGIRESLITKSVNHPTIQENTTSGERQNEVQRKKAPHTKLKVTFPDGRIINEHIAVNTFIKTIQEFGLDKVKQLGINVVSDRAVNGDLKKSFKQIINTPFYINDNNSTEVKKELIERISKMLGVEITVEIVAK
jgi:hypothetical protein